MQAILVSAAIQTVNRIADFCVPHSRNITDAKTQARNPAGSAFRMRPETTSAKNWKVIICAGSVPTSV
jgi:hypothetical protein